MNIFALFTYAFLFLQSPRRSNSSSSTGAGTGTSGAIFVLIAILFIIALVVGIVMLVRMMRKKRIQALQIFAAQNGWTFQPNATLQMFPHANAYSILNHGRRDLIAMMQREHDGGNVYLFDYAYTTGSGKNQQTHTQTVAAFHTPRLNIPFFSLYPESFFSFIGEMFGYNDIDFHTHPVFSKKFKLSGRDEMPIRSFFHPQALSFFEKMPKVRVDGGGNYLFVYFHGQTYKPEMMNNFVAAALNVYNLFRR